LYIENNVVNDTDKILILADNQPITRLGVLTVWNKVVPDGTIVSAFNKSELQSALIQYPFALVVLDYTLFDFSGLDSLLITGTRFPHTRWILFSDDLSESFLRRVIPLSHYSIVMKEAPIDQIMGAIQAGLTKKQFLCDRVKTILNSKKEYVEHISLTTTEHEILKSIAEGKTSQQIAEERCLSVHTIATHRKNIFRKIGVNNALEASKYAACIGLVDMTEYLFNRQLTVDNRQLKRVKYHALSIFHYQLSIYL
jgi:DNA-binding NarL/FixJ family response regulator